MAKGASELSEKAKAFHFEGIPTTEDKKKLKKTSNSRLPVTLQSEAFD